MGECDLLESINVVNKSKIILHSHPSQLTFGLHERILNASAVETFVLSSENQQIENAFSDNMGYFNFDFSDIKEQSEYYLENDEERITKAKNARLITARDHTWDVRAQSILNIVR